jgi:hypothetical protein
MFSYIHKKTTQESVLNFLKFATPYRFTYPQLWQNKKKASSYVSIEMHSSKRKQPNWEHEEIIAFIQTNWDEHIATLNKVDPWD